ncbi:MAG: hypothetical protein ACYTG2_13025 [Planctomycetota bacterium]|jgi:hypothetical protein
MRRRPSLSPLLCLLGPALVALSACGGEGIAPERVEEIRAAMDVDPSRALSMVRAADAGDGLSPRVALLGAEACLRLDRRDDALDWARRGLETPGLDEALECELLWAQGTALAGRYQELHTEADRRLANAVLERATAAGPRRADAAFLLAMLQDLGDEPDEARQLRYARLLFELEPDSTRAQQLRAHLESKGLSP